MINHYRLKVKILLSFLSAPGRMQEEKFLGEVLLLTTSFTLPRAAVSPGAMRQLFHDGPPNSQGREVELPTTSHALDLPADSDTRLLGGQPTLVTKTRDGLVARDADTGEQKWSFQPALPEDFDWAASEDGSFLAVRQRNQVEVLDAVQGEKVRDLQLPPEAKFSTDPVERTHSIKFGPEHTVLADYKTVGRDGGRSWSEYNLAFFDAATGQGPEIAHMGSVGHLAFAPVVGKDGQTLFCDDSYGLKALDLGADRQLWQRNDLRCLKAVRFQADGRAAVLHIGGLDVVEPTTGKTLASKKGWLADDLQVQDDRILVRDSRNESMTSLRWDGSEEWSLKLPEKTAFKQVFATDDLIYATASSEKEGHQVRLLLADPRTGDVLAQSQPLGRLQHGLPLFQAQNKVYLALEGGAISVSPADLKMDELRQGARENPATIQVGNDFVQVGGVRLRARG